MGYIAWYFSAPPCAVMSFVAFITETKPMCRRTDEKNGGEA